MGGAGGLLAAQIIGFAVEVVGASGAVARGRSSGVCMRGFHVGGLMSRVRWVCT